MTWHVVQTIESQYIINRLIITVFLETLYQRPYVQIFVPTLIYHSCFTIHFIVHAIFYQTSVVNRNKVLPIITLNFFGYHERFACTSMGIASHIKKSTRGSQPVNISDNFFPRPVRFIST